MDSPLPAVVAALVGLPLGWLVGRYRHLLYVQPEYRQAPLRGRAALLNQGGLAAMFGVTFGVAFRPDHYEPLPAAMTAVGCAVMATAASTDFERRIIPNRLVYPAMVLAAGIAAWWPDRDGTDILLGAGLALGVGVAMVVLGALLGGIVGAGTTAFGIGDAKLILLAGLLLGWPRVVGALFLGVLAGGLPALVLIVTGGRRTAYAYGPYLALGATIVLLWPHLYD